MEGALVSAATGALQSVLGKLAALLGDEYKRFKRMRSEIESLTRELEAMDAFLDKLSGMEEPDVQDKAWMKEVRELSYDIEDSLDEFMTHVGDRSAKPDGFMGKIKSLMDKTKARHRIAKAIEDLKKQVVEVGERHARYRAGTEAISKASNTTVDRRALAIFEDVSKLVGVDGPKDELIQLLTQEESTQQQPKVVSIVGSGGLGKTTLANQVYQELKGQFGCHAFLSVSRNPDMVKVLTTILSQVKEYSGGMKDVPQLITEISNFLADKRYFIVVDDIWSVETWDVIKFVFPKTSSGSKIITTTRINDVAQSCRSSFCGRIYDIRPLTVEHSRQLFYRRLFNSEEKCPSHLEGISGQILEKCDGLPLAIIAISGLLASKARTKDQWEQVKNSIGHALERNSSVEGMVKIISLSYFDLPRHLKTCLLYLSIFPEDHTIEKVSLIRRWIGEGFIDKQVGCTVHESGERCFNELINRSLIQPVEIVEPFGVTSCRVHDTILDFIVSKSVEENFVTIIGVPIAANPDPRNKVRRLSLQNDGEIPAGLVLSNARSLHVFGGNVKIPSLSEFRLLRVLDFEDCSQLEDDHLADIGNLFHLKYLRFKDVDALKKLPEQIARLQHLETLHIQGYSTMEIPATICRLQRLVCLVFDTYMPLPDEIGAMHALRVLEGIPVYVQSTNFLKKLGQLTNLRKLSIRFFYHDGDDSEELQEEMISSICELGKANLQSLHIFVAEKTAEMFEQSWFAAPCGLRELVIEGGGGLTRIPRWMGSLVNLQKLRLPMEDVGEEDLEILGGLPDLRCLCIEWFRYIELFRDSESDSELPEWADALERAMEAHPNHPTLVWASWY